MALNKIFPEKDYESILKHHKYFRNIYYLSAAIGIFPFFLQRARGIAAYFVATVSIMVTLYVVYCSIIINFGYFSQLPKDGKFIGSIEVVLYSCLVTTQTILYLMSAITSIWRVRAVRHILGILEEVDFLLKYQFRKEYDFSDFLLFFFNIILMLWVIYATEDFHQKWSILIVTMNTCLVTLQFSVLSSLISNRLGDACKSLTDLTKSIQSPYYQQKVTILSIVHDKLCDASEFLQSFGLLITVIIIFCFIGLTDIAFTLYNHNELHRLIEIEYMLSKDPNNIPPTGNILWSLFILTIVWKIAASSSEPAEKTKEFNHLLYQLIINDKSSELMQNEKLMLHLSMKREVVLTACGLFNLDFTLMHSMLAATTTYLVMLIQFGQQE